MQLLKQASKISTLPFLQRIAPERHPNSEELAGYLGCQRLALKAAKYISEVLQPGWTEKRAAKLFETYLRDHGVSAFFHFPFVWWGERSRFTGVRGYYDYLPSERVLGENEAYILDVAPIFNGYIADIGYSGFMGEPSPEWQRAQIFLNNLREKIPEVISNVNKGSEAWFKIDSLIAETGFDNIHANYPFSVLGHRVHRAPTSLGQLRFIHFGWQSYWAFLARGVFGQLLNQNFVGKLDGLWAIEPHIGGSSFGAKFEEILVVRDKEVYWLDQEC